ncbi:polyvinyl alcohol dehydrogenase (cytochrome) [Pontibacter ummariensis]|uniref:Polyvinyl alcohol dehydrogenase (Cytochrome) n=1 Tax=Pontibacter ummariensis TaxID=1610492 RepID=A0A239IRU3_9BACT|nr:PQQ-binding-like beta-propeller repeat protein [Pontibacter ummariensis]PRY09666.1 polyvinyl alcohol dehydrogenase (cytochrome) [Pontibacter ummariensis]SNS96506.1 polyvinyl alcohol dehydrogenase (cytochrome) [Pontibacter ummariensis]
MKTFTHTLFRRLAAPLVLGAALLTSCNTSAPTEAETTETEAVAVVAAAEAPAAAPINRNPLVEETLWNQHATLKSTINSTNVSNLKMDWKYATPTPVSHAPLVDDTGIYFGDWGGTVYKVDRNGQLIWKKDIEQPKKMWPWHGFAGTGTLGDGKLFEASVEGTAFAINPATGDVLWKTRFTDDQEAGNLSTLLYHDGLVYIGVQSVEEPLTTIKKGFVPDFQGKVVALNANTGALAWERVLVTPPHTGVPMWTSFALDPDQNTLFFTTGNNYTGEATELSDAIIAVDAKTGEIKWANQVTQHDVWTPADPEGPDYDFGGGAQLFVANVDGQDRKLVGGAQKSGFYHVFDATTGQKIWSTSFGYGGVDGGMHGEASIGQGRVLGWANNSYHHHQPPGKYPLSVKALNAATGSHEWVINHAQPAAIVPGYLANDVYFVGSLDGTLQAYHTADGKQLMSTKAPAPIISWLWVEGNSLYFGGGVPDMFKWADKGENGMYAYSVKQ